MALGFLVPVMMPVLTESNGIQTETKMRSWTRDHAHQGV